jgi:hypothetical protein
MKRRVLQIFLRVEVVPEMHVAGQKYTGKHKIHGCNEPERYDDVG